MLAFAFVCLQADASAQYRFDSWTTDTGLPQNSINSILQTRDGFLWITTFGGLVRYDGLRFAVFNTGNTKGLNTGRFLHMFEDREGNLWVFTENQGITRYRDGVFTTYTTVDDRPANHIRYLYDDGHGNALIRTDKGIVQWKDGAFIPYTPPHAPTPEEVVAGEVYRTAAGAVWYKDRSGFHRFEKGRVTANIATDLDFRRFFEDRTGSLWLGIRQNVLIKFEGGKLTTYSEKDGYPPARFHVAFEDSQGNLWLGTRGGGLVRYAEGEFIRYTTVDGLPSNEINCIYQDREGTLWIGTTGGLSRLSKRIITTYSMPDGLEANNSYPVYQDRQGTIWIGSWRGLTRYSNGSFTACSAAYGVADSLVCSLLEDREGNLWIGIWGGGVFRVKDGKATRYSSKEQPVTTVRAIIQDHAGNIWFGGAGGLVRYKDAAWTTFTSADGLPGQEVFVIYEDRQSNLWIGTDVGLTKYKDGLFTAYTERDGLSANFVRAIYEDGDGVLWIGTYDQGLNRFAQGRFTRYTTNEGLFDNGAFQIIEDGKENFWISCNLGIYRVRKKELNDLAEGEIAKIVSIPYGRRDGMLNSECNGGGQPAGIKANDGRLWFPTQQGVAVFAPDDIPINPQPPPVVIESLISDNQRIALHEPIEIRPGQNYFEINYSGLSFISPELVKFKYKLEGLDADWIDAETRRTAYYSHLPPGKYRFIVIAANRDGVWNEQGAALQIFVLAPFYKTWWFLAIVIFGVAASGSSLYRRRISLLKRTAQAREAFSRQLIQSQENERRRIASEIHDGLGQNLILIRNWALLGLNAAAEEKSATINLSEISETASQAINEVREIAHNLGPYQLERLGLTNTLLEMVAKVSAAHPIEFAADVAELDGLLSRESEISLYRIVQEAVNNIVKHSGALRASLEIKLDSETLIVKVNDNGKGFAGPSDSNGEGAKGFGLRGMTERVRMLGGTLGITSTPGEGTTIEVKLPIESNWNGNRDQAADRR